MERVQLNLERLLPELRDLEKKKIFTRKEIDEIVKKRTALEMSLIRKGSNEQDWLQYIDYEKKLEQLRKIRYNKLNLKGRPTVSDYSIARHILSLYSSSVTRVPGSMKLWQSYIAHVMHNSNSSAEISRVLARAIGLHPTKASIWLLAIRFEADGTGPQAKEGGIGGGNIDAARKLVMRALRFMKSATKDDALLIWLEWVRLEISFAERMRKRWEILGIQDAMSGESNIKPEANMEVDGEVEALPHANTDLVDESKDHLDLAKTATNVQDTVQKGKNAVLNGEIVKVVLTNAAAAAPADVKTYKALIGLLRSLPTPLRAGLLRHTHAAFAQAEPSSFTDPSQYALAIAFRARSRLEDLQEPSADGQLMSKIEIDSLEWIEAVEQGVSGFRLAIKNYAPAALPLREEFSKYLAETYLKTADEDLPHYLHGHLGKIDKALRNSGNSSEVISQAINTCQS